MRKNEVFKVYREYSEELEKAFTTIRGYYVESSIDELCTLRGYISDIYKDLFSEMGIGCPEISDVEVLGEYRSYLGLTSKKDNFLLNYRYVVPIRDISGRLVAMVGWYPDIKKYITTPSMFFAKESLFFNIDHAYKLSWERYDGLVFLVEGIFDCLSLRALGLPAIATMGVTVGAPKSEQLSLFRKVIAIPDNDKAGKRALNRLDAKYGWKVPPTTTFLRIKGELKTELGSLKVKDIDNLVSYFDEDDVRELLLSFADSKEELEEIIL